MSRAVDRRSFLFGAVLAGVAYPVAVAAAPVRRGRSTHPAVVYLRTVADELIAAQKSGEPSEFFTVINRHADVPAIATYSLGRFRSELPAAERPKFYRGVAAFMARYFADQSRQYRIAGAEMGGVVKDGNGELLVKSVVTLTSGSAYNVTWRLVPVRNGFKVRDVSVLGFSLTHLQRSLFHAYMARRGGLKALVAALTR